MKHGAISTAGAWSSKPLRPAWNVMRRKMVEHKVSPRVSQKASPRARKPVRSRMPETSSVSVSPSTSSSKRRGLREKRSRGFRKGPNRRGGESAGRVNRRRGESVNRRSKISVSPRLRFSPSPPLRFPYKGPSPGIPVWYREVRPRGHKFRTSAPKVRTVTPGFRGYLGSVPRPPCQLPKAAQSAASTRVTRCRGANRL